MAKTSAQDVKEVLIDISGSFAANASVSGSADCAGYSRLVGLFRSDVATTTGSGLIVEQSSDRGLNWDFVSASDLIGACTITACEVTIFGNAVRVTASNAATEGSAMRTAWYLQPVN